MKDLLYAAIFHEPGLGKTKIAIDLCLYWLDQDIVDTVFVVTKKALVLNWCDEIGSDCFVTPSVLSNDRRSNSVALNSPVLIYVMHYEVIRANFELVSDFLATCRVGAILDESHKIKNPDSKLAGCFHHLSRRFCRRVIMTGTPVANRPYDIWSQIRFLDQGHALGLSFERFKAEVDLPAPSGDSRAYALSLGSVGEKISSFTVRETKRTAGIVLPGKAILTHFVDLTGTQLLIYDSYREHMRYELLSGERLVVDDAEYVMKRLLRLVQCASNPALVDPGFTDVPVKTLRLLELLDEIDVGATKVVIWTTFVENVERLCGILHEYKPHIVHGGITTQERHQIITEFSTDASYRILIATPGAAKEGLTLTVANHAIFYDRAFGLDDYLQAQDRIHRISQDQDCYVHNLIARETIDEWVDSLLNAKYQAARVTQGDLPYEKLEHDFASDLAAALSDLLRPGRPK